MNRISIFKEEITPSSLQWIQENYKLYKGRYYQHLHKKGSGWTFPKCHESILMLKIQSVSEQKQKEYTIGHFKNDIPISWKLTFQSYFQTIQQMEKKTIK